MTCGQRGFVTAKQQLLLSAAIKIRFTWFTVSGLWHRSDGGQCHGLALVTMFCSLYFLQWEKNYSEDMSQLLRLSWSLRAANPDASQMQQKEPNASTFFYQYLPPTDVSLVKLLLAVREIHTAVTLNICSVVVICKSASLGHVIIWIESRAAYYSHVLK